MPQQRLYHEYINETLTPYIYVLTFKPCEINWDKPVLYFELIKPFEFEGLDQMDDSMVSISIIKNEILVNPSYPNSLGILLKSVKKRILQHGVDPDVVNQFVILAQDLDEILILIPKDRRQELWINDK